MANSELQIYRADLHIHTCLSPCGDWDMTPNAVVETSLRKKLDIVAISDHNTIENAEAAMRAGKEKGLIVFPAIEICSAEEVHILAFFDNIRDGVSMQEYVYEHLSGENKPEVLGYQVVANENDEVVNQNSRLLIGATSIPINVLVKKIKDMGGIAIAAHIDRVSFSIIGQLGFIPPDISLDGVEVTYREKPELAQEKLLFGMNIPCITSSDAHFIHEIGRVSTKFLMAEPTVRELKLALQGKKGRRIIYSIKS